MIFNINKKLSIVIDFRIYYFNYEKDVFKLNLRALIDLYSVIRKGKPVYCNDLWKLDNYWVSMKTYKKGVKIYERGVCIINFNEKDCKKLKMFLEEVLQKDYIEYLRLKFA